MHGLENLTAAVAKYRAANPSLKLIKVQGAEWGMLGHPMTWHELDIACPDLPIAVWAQDHHTIWANTTALEMAGILHGAETPVGSSVVMAEDGTATGELREIGAFGPVLALGARDRALLALTTGEEPDPEATPQERAEDIGMIQAALAHCARHGITTVINLDGTRY